MTRINSILNMFRSLKWQSWTIVLLAFLLGMLIPEGSDKAASHQESMDASQPQVWTCSMHPQIHLPEAGQCPICFMDLIPLESSPPNMDPNLLQLSEAAIALADIATSEVKRSSAIHEVRLSGKLAYDETRVKQISAWMPGRLDRLFVDYTGTTVKKGEHLFEIYSPELLAAQEELLQAGEQLRRVESSDELSRRTFEATRLASKEKLGLLGLSEAQINSLESKGVASTKLTVFSPISGVVVKKSAFEGSYVRTGSPVYTIADLNQLWLILDAYESDLSWLNYGQEITFEAEAYPGNTYRGIISFIDPILDEGTRTVRVRANVENEGGLLKPGMFVRAIVSSRLNKEGKVISSELKGKWVGPMHPEIIRSEPGDCDICGMPLVSADKLGYVKGREDISEPLLVPVTAVLKTGPRAIVYVQVAGMDEPTFELREVTLGPRTEEHYIVLGGLEEGERVVTRGSFKIDSAMQIAAKASMMNPQGGQSSTGHEHHGGGVNAAAGKQIEPLELAPEILQVLDPLYVSYFDFQQALAQDDFKGAQMHAVELSSVSSAIALTQGGRAEEKWASIKKQLISNLEHAEHWQDIKSVRQAFEPISLAVLELQRTFGHSSDRVTYEVYCPMAFDNKGAAWLQSSKTVNNPFFGATMLRCGEVREEFAARLN